MAQCLEQPDHPTPSVWWPCWAKRPDSPGFDGACRPPACWRRWGAWRCLARPERWPWEAKPPAPSRGRRPDSSYSPASTGDRWACSGNTYWSHNSRSQGHHLHRHLHKRMWRPHIHVTSHLQNRTVPTAVYSGNRKGFFFCYIIK